jgi:hypothetical protein
MFVRLLLIAGLSAFVTARCIADETSVESSKSNSSNTAKASNNTKGAPDGVSEPSAEKIRGWIADLDADEYWVREAATKKLHQAGTAALAALAEAGKSDKLEVSTRAIGILSRFLETNDAKTELAAETALEEIAAGRVSSAASHAESALAGYRGSRQERAVAKLRQLGADATSVVLSSGDIGSVTIGIGEGWRGTTEDLASLKRISSLQRLSIFVKSVDDQAVKHIVPLRSLTTLELYGTGISDDGVRQIAAALPAATIDRRKGGMLGVAGQRGVVGGGCLVSGVQAGSAAEKAGLQPGDFITQFEGKPVADFDSLTKLISEKSGGDTVKVDIRRDNETLKKEVKLGHWTSRTTFPGGGQIIIEDR